MAWQIEFTETAVKQLGDFDKQITRRIIKWLEDRILTTNDPRLWGAALTGDKSGKIQMIFQVLYLYLLQS